MAIYYREITVNTTEPTSPAMGDMWIKPIGTDEYEGYIWLDEWVIFIGGGVYIAGTDQDKHYLNVIIQETQPDSIIQTGWVWIKASINQAYLYLFGDYVLFAGA